MENIHGVDVSWLHNTNSRGMLSVLLLWWLGGGLVGGAGLRSRGEFEELELKSRLGQLQLKTPRGLQLIMVLLSCALE